MQSDADEAITIPTKKQQHLSQTVQSRLAWAANVSSPFHPSLRSKRRQGEENRSELQREGRTLHYITQQTPSGGGVENAMATAWVCHGNSLATVASFCSLVVVWYSPDLLQWRGRQIHNSVTSAVLTLFMNYFINELITVINNQSKGARTQYLLVSVFLLSEWRTNGWADLKRE